MKQARQIVVGHVELEEWKGPRLHARIVREFYSAVAGGPINAPKSSVTDAGLNPVRSAGAGSGAGAGAQSLPRIFFANGANPGPAYRRRTDLLHDTAAPYANFVTSDINNLKAYGGSS